MTKLIDFTFLFKNMYSHKVFKFVITATDQKQAVKLARDICYSDRSLRVVGIIAVSAHEVVSRFC